MRRTSRRQFLRLVGASAAALVTGSGPSIAAMGRRAPSASATGFNHPGQARPDDALATPDVELALRATKTSVPILPGEPTQSWVFDGEVIEGAAHNLQALPGSYLGPTLRVRRHQRVRIHFANDLDEATIVHWHGLHVPAAMDGHPRSVVAPGQTFVYEFDVTNPAGTYWYHPHPHKRTGPQVNQGLAGLFLVTDDDEDAAGLPSGAFDVPLVLQDRTFDGRNQLSYSQGVMGGMMGDASGFLGDRILVNGRPAARLTVAARPYRLRLLNGSNSRIYKLAWSDGSPLLVIGTDGGLLPAAVRREYVTLAPGERVDVWEDFSTLRNEQSRVLRSLAFSGAAMSMGGQGTLPNGTPFDVLRVDPDRKATPEHRIYVPSAGTGADPALASVGTTGEIGHGPPTRLTNTYPLDQLQAPAQTVRTFRLSSGMMTWTINGRTFDMDGVAADEVVPLGATEDWVFVNDASRMGMGGMGMVMAHPMHIHGPPFRVIERQVDSSMAEHWETVRHGYVDDGWKDTVLVMPGERVRVRISFDKHPGLFLYHCHNLEHEDLGMMRNYRVEDL